ncbi:helix-turn-helix transcriptional regulator [Chryseobacterium sp. L7]|uniref:Helix-turn-helix transcriptional regulator n=1 Tax=Chryseobacterium endalhagicum TaxID=2797638 RepID=A0ABS1QFY9_9FLAO|nr:helix-turn-helix domain-containing protein [Chryseobacterium endalhagicum]MBL1220828.1 helix-turn-helix transcriptional regulator [Chryseobacterium endalhagicum]
MKKEESGNSGCPLHSSKVLLSIGDALEAVNGKWRMKIIAVLLDEPKRFREISTLIENITDRMLSIELKKLENNLLIQRTSIYSAQAEYELTEHGKSLKPLIMELINWGEMHREKVIGSLKVHQV